MWHFKIGKGKVEYDKYIGNIGKVQLEHLHQGVSEPAKWQALSLLDDLRKNNPNRNKSEVVKVADIGCGNMQFATYLIQALQECQELIMADGKGDIMSVSLPIFATTTSTMHLKSSIGSANSGNVHRERVGAVFGERIMISEGLSLQPRYQCKN